VNPNTLMGAWQDERGRPNLSCRIMLAPS
jgi:hypothetical protein